MLKQRFATAVVAVPFFLGMGYLGGPLYGLTMCVGALVGAIEVRSMLRAGGHDPFGLILVGVAVLLPFDAWFGAPMDRTVGLVGVPRLALLLGGLIIASLIVPIAFRREHDGLQNWTLSLALGLYLGGLLQFFAPLRQFPDGGFWVMATLGCSWLCDTAAYFVGSRFGRTRLAPRISPGKSLEGALAGLVAATATAMVAGGAIGQPLGLLAGYGFAMGVATVTGDLVESFLKRQMGAKDSGQLMPGHGGLLDRMDSLLFCAPVGVMYLLLFA